MQYLIIKCEELGDQWECDANRTPITITNNWEEWAKKENPDYLFEVYSYSNNHFKCIKEYDEVMESGMCLAYYPNDEDEEPTPIKKYPNLSRKSKVPKEVSKQIVKDENYDDSLHNCGYISWYKNNILYCYTEYDNNHIYNCF